MSIDKGFTGAGPRGRARQPVDNPRDETPDYCGQCDKRTRELMTPDGPKRCACHPLARQPLPQFRTCPRCQSQIYKWDRNPCGNHMTVRPDTGAA